MLDSSARKAITAALDADWTTAISENLAILSVHPQEIDTLMRLSHAYLATGQVKEAQKYAKKATQIDPGNMLAQKCLIKCSALSSYSNASLHIGKISVDTFLEEPGRTKTVTLKHLGTAKTVAALSPAQPVILITSKRQASVQTSEGVHIGHIPDDIAAWIIFNKKQGKDVQSFIKSAQGESVKVFLKLVSTVHS